MIEVLLSFAVNLSELDAAKITQAVETEAAAHNLDPMLVYAIIKTESMFNKKAIGGSHGERGLMQLRPLYFGEVPLDVKENVRTGVKFLAKTKKACYTRYQAAWFICFNTGVNTKIKHARQFKYYKKVMENYAKLQNKHISLNGYAAL